MAMNGRQAIAHGLVARLAERQHGLEPAVADHRTDAVMAFEPGPGLVARTAADSACRAVSSGCSPATIQA